MSIEYLKVTNIYTTSPGVTNFSVSEQVVYNQSMKYDTFAFVAFADLFAKAEKPSYYNLLIEKFLRFLSLVPAILVKFGIVAELY